MLRLVPLALVTWILASGCSSSDGAVDHVPGTAADGVFRVLLFSRTVGYRHDSIPAAIAAFMQLQPDGDYQAESTEDPTTFTADNLGRFQIVVFLMTTGDVLDDVQQVAFEEWVGAGGSYLGVHSASDTEYDWPFYGQLVGAAFARHPDVQQATVEIEAPEHPAVAGLPSPWSRRDEWYDFRSNPRGTVTVLATVEESSYSGGTMGPDHPMVWAHETAGGGRAFYTGMGHTKESYAEPAFRQHLLLALRWLGRVEPPLDAGNGAYDGSVLASPSP
jgi:type 1 glutamine amidotransferase